MGSPCTNRVNRAAHPEVAVAAGAPPAATAPTETLLQAECAAKPNLCKTKLHFIAQFSSALPCYVLGLNCHNFAVSATIFCIRVDLIEIEMIHLFTFIDEPYSSK